MWIPWQSTSCPTFHQVALFIPREESGEGRAGRHLGELSLVHRLCFIMLALPAWMNRKINESRDDKAMETASPVGRKLQNQTCKMKMDLSQILTTNSHMSTQVTDVVSKEFHTCANQCCLHWSLSSVSLYPQLMLDRWDCPSISLCWLNADIKRKAMSEQVNIPCD